MWKYFLIFGLIFTALYLISAFLEFLTKILHPKQDKDSLVTDAEALEQENSQMLKHTSNTKQINLKKKE